MVLLDCQFVADGFSTACLEKYDPKFPEGHGIDHYLELTVYTAGKLGIWGCRELDCKCTIRIKLLSQHLASHIKSLEHDRQCPYPCPFLVSTKFWLVARRSNSISLLPLSLVVARRFKDARHASQRKQVTSHTSDGTVRYVLVPTAVPTILTSALSPQFTHLPAADPSPSPGSSTSISPLSALIPRHEWAGGMVRNVFYHIYAPDTTPHPFDPFAPPRYFSEQEYIAAGGPAVEGAAASSQDPAEDACDGVDLGAIRVLGAERQPEVPKARRGLKRSVFEMEDDDDDAWADSSGKDEVAEPVDCTLSGWSLWALVQCLTPLQPLIIRSEFVPRSRVQRADCDVQLRYGSPRALSTRPYDPLDSRPRTHRQHGFDPPLDGRTELHLRLERMSPSDSPLHYATTPQSPHHRHPIPPPTRHEKISTIYLHLPDPRATCQNPPPHPPSHPSHDPGALSP
jgi:hypothetical protein